MRCVFVTVFACCLPGVVLTLRSCVPSCFVLCVALWGCLSFRFVVLVVFACCFACSCCLCFALSLPSFSLARLLQCLPFVLPLRLALCCACVASVWFFDCTVLPPFCLWFACVVVCCSFICSCGFCGFYGVVALVCIGLLLLVLFSFFDLGWTKMSFAYVFTFCLTILSLHLCGLPCVFCGVSLFVFWCLVWCLHGFCVLAFTSCLCMFALFVCLRVAVNLFLCVPVFCFAFVCSSFSLVCTVLRWFAFLFSLCCRVALHVSCFVFFRILFVRFFVLFLQFFMLPCLELVCCHVFPVSFFFLTLFQKLIFLSVFVFVHLCFPLFWLLVWPFVVCLFLLPLFHRLCFCFVILLFDFFFCHLLTVFLLRLFSCVFVVAFVSLFWCFCTVCVPLKFCLLFGLWCLPVCCFYSSCFCYCLPLFASLVSHVFAFVWPALPFEMACFAFWLPLFALPTLQGLTRTECVAEKGTSKISKLPRRWDMRMRRNCASLS